MNISICSLKAYESLSSFLKDLNYSHHQLKKWLTNKSLKQHIRAQQEVDLPISLINYQLINPEYDGPYVLYEQDDDFLILHKKENQHMLAGDYQERGSLINFIQYKKPHLLYHNKKSDHGFFYRLDFVTSGISLYALDKRRQQEFRENFLKLVISKVYLAIVKGELAGEQKLNHRLKLVGEKGSKVTSSLEGTLCQLAYKVLSSQNGYSLLAIKLKQGFRHQIRAQLASAGIPITGDELYDGEPHKRVFLHAYAYTVIIKGRKKIYRSKDVNLFGEFFDLDRCLDMLESSDFITE